MHISLVSWLTLMCALLIPTTMRIVRITPISAAYHMVKPSNLVKMTMT